MADVAMQFVSDAKQLLADYEKMMAKEAKYRQKITDTGKSIAQRRKEQQALAREAVKFEKANMTHAQKYQGEINKINKLHAAGHITEKERRKAIAKAWKESELAALQNSRAQRQEQLETKRTTRLEESLGRKRQQILREIETPQQRYNNRMRDLNRLLRTGKLRQHEYAAAVRKAKNELVEQGEASERATAIEGVAGLATQWLSVGGAIAAATAALRDYAAEKGAAAQKAIEMRRSMGSLAQVAKSPEHYEQLQDKAHKLYLSGAVDSEDEGARVVFSLESAGSMKQFKFFKEAAESKLIEDPMAMARAAATMKTSMGEAETGSTRAIVSKALGASQFAPSSAEQLLEASSRSGGSARALGYSDESVLAATAIMAKATGTAAEGGTTVKSLLESLDEKRGEIAGPDGKMPATLRQALQAVEAKKLSSEELKKLFGRSEAVRAYRGLLQNIGEYDQALAAVRHAQAIDEVGRRMQFHKIDPSQVAAKHRVQAQAAVEESMRIPGTHYNLSEAYILGEKAHDRATGKSEFAIWANDKLRRFRRFTTLPVGQGQDMTYLEQEARGGGGSVVGIGNPRAQALLDVATKKLSDVAEKLDRVVDRQAVVVDRQEAVAATQQQAANNLDRATNKISNPNPAVNHGDHR